MNPLFLRSEVKKKTQQQLGREGIPAAITQIQSK